MFTEVTNGFMALDNNMFPFASGTRTTNPSSSNDILEKLNLVKSHTDLVISSALQYAEETGRPFAQMIKVGLVTLIKSTKMNCLNTYADYSDYLKSEIDNAMMDFCRKSI